MKALYFAEHGDSETLQYGEVSLPELKEGWARLRVRAVALNHLDIWIRRGWAGLKLELPHITGADVCGEIDQLSGTSSEFQVGDRVAVFPGIVEQADEFVLAGEPSLSPNYKVLGEDLRGALAEYVDVPIQNLQKVPAEISDEQAAAGNLVVTTVWRMLFTRGRLQPSESVLVVGSGGGVNSVTIQIASAFGAMVYALAGSEEKAQRAAELGAQEVIVYRDVPDWHREILRRTGKRGVDCVVDNVGEATFVKSLKALRRGGRLLTVGNTSGYTITFDNRIMFAKQLKVIGSTMGSQEEWRAGLHFMREKKLEVPIDGVYPLSVGRKQLERLERGDQFGKIVLKPE